MTNLLQDKKYLKEQYCNGSNLGDRIQLHQRFSTNKYGWMPWVFDQYDLPTDCRILEIGCGTGLLWHDNIQRLPRSWNLILSDFSEGMVKQSRTTLGQRDHSFLYLNSDAQAIPFPGEEFDAVIANHMLYHIDNNKHILAEIGRLLTDVGFAYASTPSMKNLRQLVDVAVDFSDKLEFSNDIIRGFNLENGKEVLSESFDVAERFIYRNDIIVRNSEPLLFYLASIYEGEQLDFYVSKFDEFRKYVDTVIESTGEIRINNRNALFKFGKK